MLDKSRGSYRSSVAAVVGCVGSVGPQACKKIKRVEQISCYLDVHRASTPSCGNTEALTC